MNFLKDERDELERLLPGLDAALADIPLPEMERPGNPAIPLFRQQGGPALLVPSSLGGLGASPLAAVRVQRALGSRSPSLAIATTMHHFSTGAIAAIASAQRESGFAEAILAQIAAERLYVASGFAEGNSGAGVFSSALIATPIPGGWRLRGAKKPCSLSASMDLFTASFVCPDDGRFAVAVIPAGAPGLSRRPFWRSPALAGAQSDEVVLDDVAVAEDQVAYLGAAGELDAIQASALVLFELLVTASYLGIVSALVERAIRAGGSSPAERTRMWVALEGAMAGVEGVALTMPCGAANGPLVARALFVRFSAQEAIERAANEAVGILGGIRFLESPEIVCLLASCRALVFHPPSLRGAAPALDRFLAGEPLVLDGPRRSCPKESPARGHIGGELEAVP